MTKIIQGRLDGILIDSPYAIRKWLVVSWAISSTVSEIFRRKLQK